MQEGIQGPVSGPLFPEVLDQAAGGSGDAGLNLGREGRVPQQGLEDGGLIGAAGVFDASSEATGVRKIIDITHATPKGVFEAGSAVLVLKHQGTANTGFRYTSFA